MYLVILNKFRGYESFEQGLAGFGLARSNPDRGFTEMYRCYSVIMMQGNERQNVNFGGKIILPPSALEKLASLNIEYPMLFELRNANKQRHSHAGVLEFIAEEGRVYLPHWMMQTLLLEQGDIIEIKNSTLPLGNFVKIQPQSVEFLDISDPKAVLENALRNFATLTQGDIIEISYNSKIYEILVLEVRPHNNGISILETDLEVDFDPPVGYVEPKPRPKTMVYKMKIDEPDSEPKAESQKIPGPLNLPFGKLFFGYNVVPLGEKKIDDNNTEKPALEPFSGEGQTLRAKKPSKSASPSSSDAGPSKSE
ncbi:7876_t:CDS:2 [Ambispora gerdemannii]|uniref:Ubiquitin fusion degradation protein 1 n=1 Tax=Ambispora gerdemannii TaxID=144530 RepID=A0A9N9ACB3_9GLOM|nr:7876_t:CDS:2 [Ambispora gerdemannii]